MTSSPAPIDAKTFTLSKIEEILRAAREKVGTGRFTLSIGDGSNREDYYLFHWFRKTAYAFENNKAVGSGSVEECLRALASYVRDFQRPMTAEELALTLGLKPLVIRDRRPTLEGRGDLTTQAAEFSKLAGEDLEPYFRNGWYACVGQPPAWCRYPIDSDEHHAWVEGARAADRHLSV